MSCTADFEAAQRRDMESFAAYDANGFRAVHHPEAVAINRRGDVARGIEQIMAAAAEHFERREAVFTWDELHRFVDGCRTAFIVYEARYRIEARGYDVRSIVSVTYVHEGGRWLAIADQGTPLDSPA
jgi:hypothetical protein